MYRDGALGTRIPATETQYTGSCAKALEQEPPVTGPQHNCERSLIGNSSLQYLSEFVRDLLCVHPSVSSVH